MNANIFSYTVLETQIIHPKPLQSLCINRCVPLAAICACRHPSAHALRQRGSKFDTSASLKLPKVNKKISKKNFTRRCPHKEDGRTSMSVRPHPKPTSKPPCPSS